MTDLTDPPGDRVYEVIGNDKSPEEVLEYWVDKWDATYSELVDLRARHERDMVVFNDNIRIAERQYDELAGLRRELLDVTAQRDAQLEHIAKLAELAARRGFEVNTGLRANGPEADDTVDLWVKAEARAEAAEGALVAARTENAELRVELAAANAVPEIDRRLRARRETNAMRENEACICMRERVYSAAELAAARRDGATQALNDAADDLESRAEARRGQYPQQYLTYVSAASRLRGRASTLEVTLPARNETDSASDVTFGALATPGEAAKCGVTLYIDRPCVRACDHEGSHQSESGFSWGKGWDSPAGATTQPEPEDP